jgi:hypothetical protein
MKMNNHSNNRSLFTTLLFFSGLLFSITAKPAVDDTIIQGGNQLVLNGAGYRSAYGLRMYTAGLYLLVKNTTAQEIINDNHPMAVLMVINSSLITADRLEKSTREGLMNTTDGNITPVKKEYYPW